MTLQDQMLSILPPMAYKVWWLIVRSTDHKTGRCHMSVATMAARLRCDERTIQRWTAWLARRGYISKQHVFKDGRQRANIYQVVEQQIWETAMWINEKAKRAIQLKRNSKRERAQLRLTQQLWQAVGYILTEMTTATPKTTWPASNSWTSFCGMKGDTTVRPESNPFLKSLQSDDRQGRSALFGIEGIEDRRSPLLKKLRQRE